MQYDSYYTYTYIHLLVWYYCTSWSMICIRAYMNYVQEFSPAVLYLEVLLL